MTPATTRWRWPRFSSAEHERTDWVPSDTRLGQFLRGLRWSAVAGYFAAAGYYAYQDGLPFDREGLLLWIAIGLACACIGRHPKWLLWVAVDFLPFALVLVVYDYLRGLSDTVGLPTWWHPQIDVDKFLFDGHIPTVWLQEHLKHAHVQWWDYIVCITYYSFFFLPYITAGVMWLRSRADFYRWSTRFVGLSFLGFLLFMLIPTAPPWAAGQCTALEVASHPNSPPCMGASAPPPPDGLLGVFTTHQPGANPWVERIAGESFYKLHLGVAHDLWTKGFNVSDLVAAVPSLHVGGTVLFCIFMWRRVSKWWRPALIAYPLVMQFSLSYAGEHYVADGIAGALCAWLVHWALTRLERRRAGEQAEPPDTLEAPPEPTLETPCPPTPPLPATTPSST